MSHHLQRSKEKYLKVAEIFLQLIVLVRSYRTVISALAQRLMRDLQQYHVRLFLSDAKRRMLPLLSKGVAV